MSGFPPAALWRRRSGRCGVWCRRPSSPAVELRWCFVARWSTCGSSGPGAVVEFSRLPLDPTRRIWPVGDRARWASRLRSASSLRFAAARRWCWCGRGCAVLVHRPKLRRTRSSGRVRVGVRPCGAFQLWRSPRAVDGWWTATLVLDAGEAAVASPGSASSTYFGLYFVFVLCTLYVVLC